MKNQSLFSSTDKSEKLKCRLLQFLFGDLRAYANAGLNQTLLSASDEGLTCLPKPLYTLYVILGINALKGLI